MDSQTNPDFSSIEERILTNLYESKDKDVLIILKVYSKDSENEFGISLKIKSENVNVEFDTRVAFERHKIDHKHNMIHIQGDIKRTTLDFFNNGELHIFLDVIDKEQLITACEGFTFAIVDILSIVEENLGYEKNKLINHFFAEDIIDFKPNKIELHKLIYDSLKINKIELKSRKSNDYSNLILIKKMFIMMLLFEEVKMLQPIFKNPVYDTFIEIPEIKRLNLTKEQHETNVKILIEQNKNLEQFTAEKYISEIKLIKLAF